MKSRYYAVVALTVLVLTGCAVSGDELFRRGLAYEYGQDGSPRDEAQALKMYRKAAEQGHVGAQNSLADMIFEGRAPGQRKAEAAEWYHRAAVQGSARAQNSLGDLFRDGQGVGRSDAEAVRWYILAAEQGHIGALGSLRTMLGEERGISQDGDIARNWAGDPEKFGAIGANHELAHKLEEGFASPDDPEAIKLLTALAQIGHPGAQAHLGKKYQIGRGVEPDREQALMWYGKAAEAGDLSAQKELGAVYSGGRGMPRDALKALKWLTIAQNVGRKLSDRNQSYFRPEIEEVDKLLAQVSADMTGDEIAAAQKLADEWLAKHRFAD